MKTYFLIAGFLLVAAACFIAGRMTSNIAIPLDSAALTVPVSATAAAPVHACVNQKCVAVTAQCTTDSQCATHLECNSQEKCVSVSGAGKNGCASSSDCAPVTNPTQWCVSHNTETGMTATAITYPNGNFSCNCEYTSGGTISQTPCTNSHLDQ